MKVKFSYTWVDDDSIKTKTAISEVYGKRYDNYYGIVRLVYKVYNPDRKMMEYYPADRVSIVEGSETDKLYMDMSYIVKNSIA